MDASICNSQGNTLTASNGRNELLPYVSFCLAQAREYLRLAHSASLLSKPHLLFCSFSLFAKALISAKAGYPKDEPTHGLTNRGTREGENLIEREVIVKEKGLFQSLHLCFSNFPIKSGTRLSLKSLLGCVEGMDFPKLFELEEPTAHIAISFLLSMICRYEPLRWMRGKEEKWIEKYMEIATNRFPNLIEKEIRSLGFKI